jgi:hypothetical protein
MGIPIGPMSVDFPQGVTEGDFASLLKEHPEFKNGTFKLPDPGGNGILSGSFKEAGKAVSLSGLNFDPAEKVAKQAYEHPNIVETRAQRDIRKTLNAYLNDEKGKREKREAAEKKKVSCATCSHAGKLS